MEIRGQSAEARRAVRQDRAKPVVAALKTWLMERLAEVSGKSVIAEASRLLIIRDCHPGAPVQAITKEFARRSLHQIPLGRKEANVVSPSVVDGFLWNGKLQPSAYDSGAMGAISAGLHAPIVIWGQVDQFTPYSFRSVCSCDAGLRRNDYQHLVSYRGTKTATINKQGSLPFTIWDKQPTFQDVALDEVPDFFAGSRRP